MIFDTSKPEIITRAIVDTRKSIKPVSYYVKFGYEYSQSITGNELRVPYEIYKNNNNVNIYIKSGFLHIKYIDNIQ